VTVAPIEKSGVQAEAPAGALAVGGAGAVLLTERFRLGSIWVPTACANGRGDSFDSAGSAGSASISQWTPGVPGLIPAAGHFGTAGMTFVASGAGAEVGAGAGTAVAAGAASGTEAATGVSFLFTQFAGEATGLAITTVRHSKDTGCRLTIPCWLEHWASVGDATAPSTKPSTPTVFRPDCSSSGSTSQIAPFGRIVRGDHACEFIPRPPR
jgi:hypothetical protein